MSGIFNRIRFTEARASKINNIIRMASDNPALPGSTV